MRRLVAVSMTAGKRRRLKRKKTKQTAGVRDEFSKSAAPRMKEYGGKRGWKKARGEKKRTKGGRPREEERESDRVLCVADDCLYAVLLD